MNNIEKFYKKTLEEINNLIEKNELEKAIDMIEDELEAPYIPIEYLEKFEELLLEIKFQKNYKEESTFLKKIDKNDFLKNFNNKNQISEIIYFFEKFQNTFTEIEKNTIYNFLQDKNIENNKKILIAECLKKIDNNRDFTFYNSNLKKLFKLDMRNLNFIESIDFFIMANKMLNNLIYKEPTLIEISYTIIYSFYEYFFPDFILGYSYEDFVFSIINVVENILKGKTIKETKASKDIMKVINKIN